MYGVPPAVRFSEVSGSVVTSMETRNPINLTARLRSGTVVQRFGSDRPRREMEDARQAELETLAGEGTEWVPVTPQGYSDSAAHGVEVVSFLASSKAKRDLCECRFGPVRPCHWPYFPAETIPRG